MTAATLPGLLLRQAAERPDAVALREKEFGIWQSFTWAQYLERVRAFSLGLVALGLDKGPLSLNAIDFYIDQRNK